MSISSRIGYWICCVFFLASLNTQAATPIKSLVIFGDSLSDIGNTTHLLKSLKQQEDPSYLIRPVKALVINKMIDFAEEYYVPEILLEEGISKVTWFFDHDVAPLFADLVSKIRRIPVIPAAPYWNSRYTNGRVWIEYLAPMLNIDKEEQAHYSNRAFSGSWAMTYNKQLTIWNLIQHPLLTVKSLINGKLIPPSLGLSVQAYLMETRKVDQEAVYFVYSGSNDYLNALVFNDTYNPATMSKYIDNVINDISTSVNKLSKAGARRFVVLGLPHIGNTPIFNTTMNRPILNAAVDQHNQRLQQQVTAWQSEFKDHHFIYIDIQKFFVRALKDPVKYRFSNVSEACIDVKIPMLGLISILPSTFRNNFILQYAQAMQYRHPHFAPGEKNYHVCATPESYLFWDAVHPTTWAHRLLAYEVCEEMKSQGYEAQCLNPLA